MNSMEDYLRAVKFMLETEDGANSALLLSLRNPHATLECLQAENPEGIVKSEIYQPFDLILIEHIKVLFHLARK